MKLSDKRIKQLDEKCQKTFGTNFDTMYHLVENIMLQIEKEKIEQKRLKNLQKHR